MNLMRKLSIRLKILLIPFTATLGFALVLAYIYVSNTNNIERINLINDSTFPVLDLATKNSLLLKQVDDTLKSAAIKGEQAVLDDADKMEQGLLENLALQKRLAPDLAANLNQINDDMAAYFDLATQLARGFVNGNADLAEMTEMSQRRKTLYSALEDTLIKFKQARLEAFKAALKQTSESQAQALNFAMIIGLATLVGLLAISFSAIYLVNSSIGEVAQSLKAIAQGDGDLTKRIGEHGNDELGQLVRWFNVFVDKLQHTISEVVQTIQPLLDVSSKMQNLSTDTSSITSKQEVAFDEMSDEMRSLLLTVREVNDNADSAAEAAHDADSEAKSGSVTVDDTVNSISQVAQQVQRATDEIIQLEANADNVGNILDVIRGIAEQTNLLALNAAIEAARAGEQGRGFAVVADEVRTLASRTQESTTEIQTLIENLQRAAQSTSQVMTSGKELTEACVEKASAAGLSLKTITEKVTRITDMNRHIAKTTKQQENYTNTINQNIGLMNKTSHDVNDNIEEVSGLSNSLHTLADKLNAVSTQFKV